MRRLAGAIVEPRVAGEILSWPPEGKECRRDSGAVSVNVVLLNEIAKECVRIAWSSDSFDRFTTRALGSDQHRGLLSGC